MIDYIITILNDCSWIQFFAWAVFIICLIIWVATRSLTYKEDYRFKNLNGEEISNLDHYDEHKYQLYRYNIMLAKIAKRFIFIALPIIILFILIPNTDEGKEVKENCQQNVEVVDSAKTCVNVVEDSVINKVDTLKIN